MSIKGLPKEVDHGEVIEWLVKSGLPEEKTDNITFCSKGTVNIRDLENTECVALIESIHGKRYLDRKVDCNGIIPLTPEKPIPALTPTPAAIEEPFPPLDTKISDNSETGKPLAPDSNLPLGDSQLPAIVCSSSDGASQEDWNNLTPYWPAPSNDEVVRRYSLSLENRIPPGKSLAADILGTQFSLLKPRNTIMSNIKDIQDALSDFNSCNSTLDSSSSSSDEPPDVVKKERKRKKKGNKLPGRIFKETQHTK